jgi:hypothetical protein
VSSAGNSFVQSGSFNAFSTDASLSKFIGDRWNNVKLNSVL